MGKYIDTARIDWRLIIPTNATTAEENMIYRARKLVEFQPAADVVEVVRCKDCYFAEPKEGTVGFYTCMSGLLVGENHFCSYGKEKR